MKNSLFRPLQIGNMQLPNRLIMAPMTRGRADMDTRTPNALMAKYYGQRASAGLIITEATAVAADGYGWVGAPAMYSDAHQEGWKQVTDTVHARGGRIFLQLWHMGRVSHPDFLGGELPVGPSAIAARGESVTPDGKKPYVVPRVLTGNELEKLIEAYGRAAHRAVAAGFDGVEIHSANGYLLDQFLRDCSNQRTDEYGGSIQNRMRFPLEVVDGVVAAVSKARVGVRISPVNAYNDMRDSDPQELFSQFAAELAKREIAYLHVLEALPKHFLHTEGIEPVLPAVRKAFPGVLMANGGYMADTAAALIDGNKADAVAFGVPFLATPDLVKRFRIGAGLNTPDTATFYTHDPQGYTDYPFLEDV